MCSMGELAGMFHYYKKISANIYAILACHPSLDDARRKTVIKERREKIQRCLSDVDRESLDVVIDRNGTITKYTPEDFTTIRDKIKNQLTLSLKAV